MLSFLCDVVAAASVFSLLGSVQAVPLADKLGALTPAARDVLKRSTPSAPHFVAYNDKYLSTFPSASELKGFNVFALAFLLASGSVDEAQNWQELTADQRASYIREYDAAGISLIVSAFGSTETPTSSGVDPSAVASTMADWVIKYGVGGVDVDYEDFTAFNSKDGIAEPWLITYTQQLRKKLPVGQYILTHAPVMPWFSPSLWSGGGYLAVERGAGTLIDWYNVQAYNQGETEYTTCSGLLDASSSQWPQTALFQIVANGVNKDKLVIGKPGTPSDANNGYVDPSTLATCAKQAHSKGWNAGIMVWEYPDANSEWITTVRGDTWPVSGSASLSPTTPPPSATTTSSASAPSSTGSSGSGSCAGASAWSTGVAYPGGSKVSYNGNLWTAKQWNEDETPGGSSGAWTKGGACA